MPKKQKIDPVKTVRRRIGRLTLLTGEPNGTGNYTYACDCGQTVYRTLEELYWKIGVHRCSLSCESRLRKVKQTHSLKSPTELTYQFYQDNATYRAKTFEIPFELFEKMIFDKCYYCDAPPTKLIGRNGIDCVDNTRGYTLDNTVTCCFPCNKLKSIHGRLVIERYAKIYLKMLDFFKSCK